MKHTQSIVEIFWRYCEESGLDLKLAAYISKSKPERLYQRNSLGNNTHPVLHELVFWLTSFLISITVRLPRDRLLFLLYDKEDRTKLARASVAPVRK